MYHQFSHWHLTLYLTFPSFRFAHFPISLAVRKHISGPFIPADLPQCTSFQFPGVHNTLYPTRKQEQNVTGLCFYSQFAINHFPMCYIIQSTVHHLQEQGGFFSTIFNRYLFVFSFQCLSATPLLSFS